MKNKALFNYYPNFLTSNESYYLLKMLQTTISWESDELIIFGKKMQVPRLTAWYCRNGKTYKYSGNTKRSIKEFHLLDNLIKRVSCFLKLDFNGVLLNYYRDGNDSVSWHRDDEKQLGNKINLATLSLGTARPFLLRNTSSRKTQKLVLQNGSLFLMRHPFQRHYHHCLPKAMNIKKIRISITFRKIIK